MGFQHGTTDIWAMAEVINRLEVSGSPLDGEQPSLQTPLGQEHHYCSAGWVSPQPAPYQWLGRAHRQINKGRGHEGFCECYLLMDAKRGGWV